MSDLSKVKELRKATGAGFKDCNNALKEANGNIEKSIEILRVKGISKASKKMSRDASEGLVAIYEEDNKKSIIEINCETDFVAKNDDFMKFAYEISELNNAVSSDTEKLKNIKMKNGIHVKDNLINIISKIGEKITLGRSKTFENKNQKNYTYMHSVIQKNLSKLGVIVSLQTNKSNEEIDVFGKQLAMHIAASNPLSLLPEGLEDNIIEKESKLIAEELQNTGKPKEIIDKIALGKLNKFKDENSLMEQFWVMDPKKKVKEIIKSLKIDDLVISDFCRIKIGE